MLASGRLDAAQYCNGKRADAQLKDIPADHPVYKRHSAKLYRAYYMEKFGSMATFLRDQRDNDYTDQIEEFGKAMKKSIRDKTANLEDPSNPNYDAQLNIVLGDVDNLITWAKERSLYWALQLLYYVQNSALPNCYSQYTSGNNTNQLSMRQKQLNTLFGMLENNQVNTKKDGRNFMQTYNDDMRLFQMTSIIPTLIDIRGNSTEIDSLITQCLWEYIENFKASPDQNHIEAVEAATKLYSDKYLRDNFWLPLANAARLGSAATSWQQTMLMWEKTIRDAKWFQNLASGSKLLAVFQSAAAAVFIMMPLLPGMWSQMSDIHKLTWKLSLAGLCAGFVIKIGQGVVRFYYLHGDIAGFIPSLKCCLGFEGVVDAIPHAAEKMESSWTRFFTRTSKQTLSMQEMENLINSEMVGQYAEFNTFQKMMGRNMGELLGTIAGLAIAAASIVMTAFDLETQTEGALIAMDIFMILSSVIQILSVVAGWITAAGAAGTGAMASLASYSAISMCATWGGPLAIVFALIGVIIFIVWYFNQDHRDPTQKFLDDYAEPAGLRMPGDKQAPEYLEVVPPSEGNPSLVGLSIAGPLVSAKEYIVREYPDPNIPPVWGPLKIPTTQQLFMKLNADGQVPALVEQVDYSMNTIWSLETDPDGKSFIYTAAFTPKTNADGKKDGVTRTIWYLGTSDDNTKVVYRELPSKSEPDKRTSVLPHVQWKVDVVEKPTQDVADVKDSNGVVTKPGKVLTTVIGISQNGAKLGRWVTRKTLQIDAGLTLTKDENAIQGSSAYPDKMFCVNWTVNLSPIGPSDFSYSNSPWKLDDKQTDLRNIPHFLLPSTFSGGLEWKIEPALPVGVFELVTVSGVDEGLIKQVAGVTAPVMARTTYTVSCSMKYKGVVCGTRTTTVEIEVVPFEDL